ncbi:Putative 149 kDa protein [Durusdinium trenchii]|uniref:149 kDa protein n=1 Tax=Durusdinium trenchii TaxID=1381693 RepID=A0ABP0P187_9DINO
MVESSGKIDEDFFQGRRAKLFCAYYDDGICHACTMDKALPKLTLKVMFVKGIESILPVGTTFILENFALSLEESPVISGALTEGPLLPLVLPKPADRGIAEIFAGIGGWGMATEAFGALPLVSLEKDHATAKCHAQNVMIPMLETKEAITKGLAGELPARFILVGDVFDSRCWIVMSWKRIAHYFASPPCQSWSGAGWQQGLDSINGQAMEVCIERTTMLNAKSLTMENVPSIQTHPDLQQIKKLINECNYVIGHEGIDEIYPVLPIKRKRWMMTILPKGKSLELSTIEYAKQVKFPTCLPVFGARNSLALARAFNDHILPWEQEALKPSADAMELAKDRSLLPRHMLNGPTISSQEEVIKRRTIGQWEPVPSLMSCYGGQHELPRDLLKHHGLHSWFVKDGEHIRYLSPFEGAFALGFSSKLILPADFRSAHRLIGNAISFAHSTLQTWRTHLLLGQDSPFRTDVLGISDLVDLIFDRTGRFGDNVVVKDGSFARLAFPGAAERKRSPTEEVDSSEDSQPKRARSLDISPTVPFEVIGMDPCEVDLAMPYLKPSDLQAVSVAARLYTQPLDQGAFEEGSQEFLPVEHLNSWEQGRLVQVANMIPCQLLHEQKIWTEFVWLPKDTNIGFAIQQALPHSLECHFNIIQHDIAEVGFHDPVNPEQPCTIFLDTVKIDRLVSPTFTQDSLLVSVDVCWKFSDLIAYVASQCGVLPSKVVILDDHAPMPDAAFVLQQLTTSFKAALVTSPLDTRQLMPKKFCDFAKTKEVTIAGVKVSNPMHTDNAVPADSAAVRFAARNPHWGSIRSIAINKQESVSKLVLMLFPDFLDSIPNVTAESALIDPSDPVEALIAKPKLEVHFEGFKPWPVTDLEFLLPFGQPTTNDPAYLVPLWVQGPFDYRAKRVQVDKEWTLTKLAASYLVLHRSNLTMIVLQHGKPLDPRQTIQHVCSDHEIQIRVCALPGGAKSEDLVKFLEPLLMKRGVPGDAVKARVQSVLAKLDHATIRAHMHDDAQTFWGYLKQWANDAKLRLITPDELKAQKKAGRAEARVQAASSSASPAVQKFQEASTQQVVIDTSHFLANGLQVPKIDINAFAPDSTGIAVVSPSEALKCMPVRSLSVQPLALVVLTISLLGVEFQHKLPQTKLVETPVVVLELMIRKDLVNDWNEVQSPLAYLGLHIPEMRKDAVIEAWSIAPYDKHRWKSKHDYADYIHGFCKVRLAVADDILKRSGVAGIFLAPKTPDKKRDLAYSLIQIPGKSLDEVVSLSKDVAKTLGVVECAANYAIRTRREHIHEVRAKILPQSVAIQEGLVQSDADWFLLKGLRNQTTHENLTAVLQTMGWKEVHAVRPTRGGAWLLNAKSEPPFMYFQINDTYVSVVKLDKKNTGPKTHIDKDVHYQVVHATPSHTPTSTTSTRIDELQERLTNIINDKIADKMRETQSQMADIKSAVTALDHGSQQQQAAVMEIKKVQDQCSARVDVMQQSMQQAIIDGNTTILQKMDALFQQFGKSVETRLTAIENKVDETDPCKRAKTSTS